MSLVWERFPRGGSELLTMIALADWAGDDGGRIYPSMAGLAAKIRMSERQAKRITDRLIKDGFLVNLTPENRGGRLRSNRYRIDLKTLTNCPMARPGPDNLSDNSDIAMSDNSDIAMSGDTLKPLSTVTASATAPPSQASASRWNQGEPDQGQALAGYIRALEIQVERNPELEPELDRARKQLAAEFPALAQAELAV